MISTLQRTPRHLLDHAAPEAADRWAALSALYDEATFSLFRSLGVARGWHCLEVGAGSGSVARRLSETVGPTGAVLATDVDTRRLDCMQGGNIEVRRLDLRTDPLPTAAFDLVHIRSVLCQLSSSRQLVRRLVAAVRPGGVLLIEEFDTSVIHGACPDPRTPAEFLANRVRQALVTLLHRHSANTVVGGQVARMLRDCHLTSVAAEGRVAYDGPAVHRLDRANIVQAYDELVGSGLVHAAEVEFYLETHDRIPVCMPALISTWGTRAR